MIEVAPEKKRPVAAEAFLFGYPLVLMDLTRAVLTHIAQPAAALRRRSAARPFGPVFHRGCCMWFPRTQTSSRFVLLSGALR